MPAQKSIMSFNEVILIAYFGLLKQTKTHMLYESLTFSDMGRLVFKYVLDCPKVYLIKIEIVNDFHLQQKGYYL